MKRLSLLLILALSTLALRAENAAVIAVNPPAAKTENAKRAAEAGSLEVINGVRVLKLYSPKYEERGFAHGYLLAPDIRECLEDALKALPFFSGEKFTKNLIPWYKKSFVWDLHAKQELKGLWDGVKARLTEDAADPEKALFCEGLGRELNPEDIEVLSVIGDYFGPACSGFVATGANTKGGEVIHARNLDFPIGPKASMKQMVIVSFPISYRWDQYTKDEKGQDLHAWGHNTNHGWVGIGWPGLIAIYSAMNDKGLTCCLHDATNLVKGGAEKGFTPRGMLLRRIVERVDPNDGDPAEAAVELVAKQPVACGNLFQLSWPKAAAEKTKTQPGAVLEFDSADRKPQSLDGISIRRMDESGELVLTNHCCVRSKPVQCNRFSAITDGLESLKKDHKEIGVPEARKLMIGAEMPLAAHTVVFEPDFLKFTVSFTRGNLLSTRAAGKEFELESLLKK